MRDMPMKAMYVRGSFVRSSATNALAAPVACLVSGAWRVSVDENVGSVMVV